MGVKLIDTYEAAEMLGVKPGTVRDLAYSGALTRHGYAQRKARYGRPRALFDRREVEQLRTRRLRLRAA